MRMVGRVRQVCVHESASERSASESLAKQQCVCHTPRATTNYPSRAMHVYHYLPRTEYSFLSQLFDLGIQRMYAATTTIFT
jgi:hypothetical protein